MLVRGVRLIVLFAAIGSLATAATAARRPGSIPLPRPRPVIKSEKAVALAAHVSGRNGAITPSTSLAPALPQVSAAASARGDGGLAAPASSTALGTLAAISATSRPSGANAPPARARPPLAVAASSNTSPLDVAAAKQAIELVRRNRQDEATSVEATISDPLARKLVEWVILRSEDADLEFARYAAFVVANPSWPSITGLRRRAEAALWQQNAKPRAAIAFFGGVPPRSAKGAFALARALLTAGEQAGAQTAVRDAWRNDAFSAEVEEQARDTFGALITPADDKARMDARLYVGDDAAALRAARHLDAAQLTIARARAAVNSRSASARALLEAVPAAARGDPGYLFSRIQWLRRAGKVIEAARLMITAPTAADRLGNLDQWWIERRLVARKLIDLGDFKAAYEIAARAAVPVNENYRAEQQFTAGWLALRFLHEPTAALAHFARISNGVLNPITLARADYWQGRAADALGRGQDARAYYEAAARYPTAYYGQLARARLGLDSVDLRQMPEPAAEHRRLELARAFEILYAADERDLVAVMAADLGDKVMDASALAALAGIAVRHHDARTALLIGKAALGHGLPLAHYAFPAFGVPSFRPIGPEVEPCVVYAIARQESAFNPRVVSSANALGLMQVTPDAGRFIAKKFNVTYDQRRLLDDPAYNAQIGTAELGDDIREFGGSYVLAAAAYNAGVRRVMEWIGQYGDPRSRKVDPIDWIERIPFSETRNYVQRVIENLQVYRARMGNDSRLLIEADLRRGGRAE